MAATIISDYERTQRTNVVGSKVRSLARLSRDIGKQNARLRAEGNGPAAIQTAIQAQLDEYDSIRDAIVAELTAIPYLHQPIITAGLPAISNAMTITAINLGYDFFSEYYALVQPDRIASGDEWSGFFAAGDIISLNNCEDSGNDGSYIVRAVSTGTPSLKVSPYNSPEILENGAFAADSDWTKDANWTIAGGKAVSGGGTGYIYQPVADMARTPTPGSLSRVTITTSGATTGYISVGIGGGLRGICASNASYEFILDFSGTNGIEIYSENFDGDIEIVSMKEVGGVLIARPTEFTTNTADTKCRVLKEYDA